MPTCDAPRAVVVKNSRSPGASSSRLDRLALAELLCDLARQRDAVLRETYWVKPLQSNPPGSVPPFR